MWPYWELELTVVKIQSFKEVVSRMRQYTECRCGVCWAWVWILDPPFAIWMTVVMCPTLLWNRDSHTHITGLFRGLNKMGCGQGSAQCLVNSKLDMKLFEVYPLLSSEWRCFISGQGHWGASLPQARAFPLQSILLGAGPGCGGWFQYEEGPRQDPLPLTCTARG